jgi:Fervidolysin N-terminal prodomain
MKWFAFAILFASLFVVAVAAVPQDKKSAQQKRAPMKEVIVKFKPDVKPEQINAMAAELGLQQIKEIPALRLRVYKITSPKSLKEVIEYCGKQAGVEYAEPNRVYKTLAEPAKKPVSPKKVQ